ncbi:MAG: quinone-dependent dihydroorotate dehydrogenase [bacterium]|nr:quinone-dependent dihydroorotate dehydrogenase [bacterium]
MNETATYYRNKIIHTLYQTVLRPIFFRNDPESVHDRMTKMGVQLGRFPLGQKLTKGLFGYENPALAQEILGITFKNPIGLSAGFDKNAELTDILPSVGFGFAEVGSITGNPCQGNSKPRLWRLPKSKSLAVYYGLKNDGCEAIAKRLRGKRFAMPVGISVAVTNCKENLERKNAVDDFAKAFRIMEAFGDYITVNISCPNTEGGQLFLTPHALNYLFNTLDKIPTLKPVFIKLSPDINQSEIDAILDIARLHRIHGIICSNVTKKRNNPKIVDAHIPNVGGMSGKVVQDIADTMLAYIYKKEGKRFVLIGSGGIFTAEDAYKKIRLGASLVQIITGMIFEGPQVISEINRGLVALLRRDGFKTISEAVGADNC